jgi:hypothetical protein
MANGTVIKERFMGLDIVFFSEGSWGKAFSEKTNSTVAEFSGISRIDDIREALRPGFVIVAHFFEGRKKDAFLVSDDPKLRTRKTSECSIYPTYDEAFSRFLSCRREYASLGDGALPMYAPFFRIIPVTQAEEYLAKRFPPKRRRITAEERKAIYGKFGGRCAYCGHPIAIKDMEIDHFASHSNHLGDESLDNLMPSCHDCNAFKSDMTIDDFRASISNLRKTPIIGSAYSIENRILKKYPFGSVSFLFESAKKK